MDVEKKIEQINSNAEQASSVEKPVDASFDSSHEQKVEKVASEKPDKDQAATAVAQAGDASTQNITSQPMTSEIVHARVENILAKDMDKVFLSLDAGTQRAFKIKGEKTSKKITSLLMQTKVKAKEITMLILEWLRIIPKINKHYLEQEAKIKTDDILKINQQK